MTIKRHAAYYIFLFNITISIPFRNYSPILEDLFCFEAIHSPFWYNVETLILYSMEYDFLSTIPSQKDLIRGRHDTLIWWCKQSRTRWNTIYTYTYHWQILWRKQVKEMNKKYKNLHVNIWKGLKGFSFTEGWILSEK